MIYSFHAKRRPYFYQENIQRGATAKAFGQSYFFRDLPSHERGRLLSDDNAYFCSVNLSSLWGIKARRFLGTIGLERCDISVSFNIYVAMLAGNNDAKAFAVLLLGKRTAPLSCKFVKGR